MNKWGISGILLDTLGEDNLQPHFGNKNFVTFSTFLAPISRRNFAQSNLLKFACTSCLCCIYGTKITSATYQPTIILVMQHNYET